MWISGWIKLVFFFTTSEYTTFPIGWIGDDFSVADYDMKFYRIEWHPIKNVTWFDSIEAFIGFDWIGSNWYDSFIYTSCVKPDKLRCQRAAMSFISNFVYMAFCQNKFSITSYKKHTFSDSIH